VTQRLEPGWKRRRVERNAQQVGRKAQTVEGRAETVEGRAETVEGKALEAGRKRLELERRVKTRRRDPRGPGRPAPWMVLFDN
jgi:hypothetical protein